MNVDQNDTTPSGPEEPAAAVEQRDAVAAGEKSSMDTGVEAPPVERAHADQALGPDAVHESEADPNSPPAAADAAPDLAPEAEAADAALEAADAAPDTAAEAETPADTEAPEDKAADVAEAPAAAETPEDKAAEVAEDTTPDVADVSEAGEVPGAEAEAAEAAEAVVAGTEDGEKPRADGAKPKEPDWTNFSPEPERIPGRVERVLRRVGRFCIHEWTLAAVGALILAVIMTWPSARHPASTIPADIWDPTLQAWELAWAGHILFTDPSQLWNANAFYPDTYSFAFSDTLLGYLPASLIGNGPTAALVRYNVMFILLHALALFGAYALIRQLGGPRAAAAMAGAAFAYAPWRWGQAGHMHVLSVGGIALALAMLARGHGVALVRDGRLRPRRPGWALAGWLTAAWQVSIGFGIGLPFAYVLAVLVVFGAIAWLVRGRPTLGRRLIIFDLVGGVVFAAVGGLMSLPYLQVLKLHPEARRSITDIQMFSPTLRSFFTAPEQSLFWGSAHAAARLTMPYPAETTLLPGFTIIGLAFAGLFFSIWTVRARFCLLIGTAASVILGMGTNFLGGRYTYVPLFHHLPGWNAIRTPGRLVVWTTLLLAILAAGAVGAMVQRSNPLTEARIPSRPSPLVRLALLLPLLLVIAEGTNWTKLQHPEVPKAPAAMSTVGAPLLVLPSDPLTDSNIMLWSTTKFQRMVNGNSGFYPTDQQQTRQAAKSFPDQPSVDYLRQLGIKYVLVVKDRAAGGDYAKAASLDTPVDGLGITRVDQGDTILYTLN